MPFKPEYKSVVLEALRSDRFKQCYGVLGMRDKGECKYCVLGVIAKVCGCTIGSKFDEDLFTVFEGDEHSTGYLPSKTMDRIGLTVKEMYELLDLNDSKRWTYSAIANYIEQRM